MKSTRRYYRVDRRELAFLRFIFEAYDGIAVVSTLDARKGRVVITIAPGCEADVDFVLTDLKRNMLIEDDFKADLPRHEESKEAPF